MLSIMTAFPLSVQAQNKKISLDAGISNSVLKSDVSNLINTRYNTRAGAVSRVSLEYNFYKDFIVASGIGLYKKVMIIRKRTMSREQEPRTGIILSIYRCM